MQCPSCTTRAIEKPRELADRCNSHRTGCKCCDECRCYTRANMITSPAQPLHLRSGPDHRSNSNPHHSGRSTLWRRLCLDRWCISACQCSQRQYLGESVGHLGPQADSAGGRCAVLCLVDRLCHRAGYAHADRWPEYPGCSRGWTYPAYNDNHIGFV